MKYRVLALVLIVIAVMCISVSASTYEYSISPGDDFTSVQSGDDFTQISQKLNMSVDQLNTYFSKNGLIYLAVSNDAKSQIRISAFTDNFSSAVNDIAYLDDVTLNEFISAISEGNESNCEIIVNKNRKFILVKDTLKDSGGVYTVTQYITICNNHTFYFAGYNQGENTSPEIKKAFESFTVNELQVESPNYTVPTILIIAGIVASTAVAVFMIIGIVKSAKRTKCNK